MTFAKVYHMYVSKVEKKGRTQDELDEVIRWLTGFSQAEMQQAIDDNLTFAQFFDRATLHPNADQIKGVICGYRIEELETALTRKVRYLDKLVDELAKRKAMERVLRAG